MQVVKDEPIRYINKWSIVEDGVEYLYPVSVGEEGMQR